MQKTHKKILGFVGLGLVAATTAVAVAMPSPTASAVSTSVTDTLKVTVVSPNPDLVITSSDGSVVTNPEYHFSVSYGNLLDIKATLTNYDGDGNIKYSEIIWNETLDGSAGTKDFTLNLDNYGGRGNFVINFAGTGADGVRVEQILSVKYTRDSEEADPEPGSDETDVPVDVPTDEVKTVVVEVHSQDGSLIKTITVSDPNDVETLDLSDLADGIYTLVVITKDKDGNIIETKTITAIVDKGTGIRPAIPVEIENHEGTSEVVIEIKDSDGNVVQSETITNPTPGTVNVDVSGLPSGDYTVTTTYYDENGNVISATDSGLTISDTNGQTNVPVDTVVDSVTTIEAYIYDKNGDVVRVLRANRATGLVEVYDANGNLLFTINNGYKNGKLTISMEGLAYGDYTGLIMFRDANGRLVGDTIPLTIKYYGKEPVIVPDTGSFFQGLNITREDYLITGLIVFMVISAVAFGIVMKNRNHSNKKTTRINGKVRR